MRERILHDDFEEAAQIHERYHEGLRRSEHAALLLQDHWPGSARLGLFVYAALGRDEDVQTLLRELAPGGVMEFHGTYYKEARAEAAALLGLASPPEGSLLPWFQTLETHVGVVFGASSLGEIEGTGALREALEALWMWSREERRTPSVLGGPAFVREPLREVVFRAARYRLSARARGLFDAWGEVDLLVSASFVCWPGQGVWFGMGQRAQLIRLCQVLVEGHLAQPGRSIDLETLAAAIWPGEFMTDASLRRRLQTLVSTLRQLGFGADLGFGAGGYHLRPGLRVRSI